MTANARAEAANEPLSEDELCGLRRGDVVEVWVGGAWATATVTVEAWRPDGRDVYVLRARRVGLTKAGRRYGEMVIVRHEVRRQPNLEPGAGNVYADWLEDHGEARAAAKLREAFPIAAPPAG